MKLYSCILTQNDCYRRGATIVPKGVMVHSTGCNNPNIKRYVQPDDGILGVNSNHNDWNHSGMAVCVHGFIGKTADGTVATYQTLPWNHRGWHAGGAANNTHISFEICEDGLTDASYFAAVYKEAVELTAMLCKQYALDPLQDGVVIDHAEGCKRGLASNHGDVGHWFPKFGKSMDSFRAEVAYFMEHKCHRGEEKELRYATLANLKADKHNAKYYVPTVTKLLELGVLNGKGGTGDELRLDLGEDAIRLLVVLDREGIFG